MIKNLTALEVKVGERVYKLLCEIDSPLGEVHDILCQMKSHIVSMINKAHEDQQKSQSAAIIPDEVA